MSLELVGTKVDSDIGELRGIEVPALMISPALEFERQGSLPVEVGTTGFFDGHGCQDVAMNNSGMYGIRAVDDILELSGSGAFERIFVPRDAELKL